MNGGGGWCANHLFGSICDFEMEHGGFALFHGQDDEAGRGDVFWGGCVRVHDDRICIAMADKFECVVPHGVDCHNGNVIICLDGADG